MKFFKELVSINKQLNENAQKKKHIPMVKKLDSNTSRFVETEDERVIKKLQRTELILIFRKQSLFFNNMLVSKNKLEESWKKLNESLEQELRIANEERSIKTKTGYQPDQGKIASLKERKAQFEFQFQELIGKNTWTRIQEISLISFIKRYMGLIIIVIMTPFVIGFVVSSRQFVEVSVENDWIGFYGNYMGAILGGVVAFIVAKLNISYLKAENEEQKTIEMKYRLLPPILRIISKLKIHIYESYSLIKTIYSLDHENIIQENISVVEQNKREIYRLLEDFEVDYTLCRGLLIRLNTQIVDLQYEILEFVKKTDVHDRMILDDLLKFKKTIDKSAIEALEQPHTVLDYNLYSLEYDIGEVLNSHISTTTLKKQTWEEFLQNRIKV